MLYVMICYKSMTSDYCFHTSNILKKQQTSSQNHKISSFEITKESIQVVLKCKNTLIPTKLFQNVICNDMLQINDLILLFSYIKYSQRTINIISKSQNFFILNQKRINTSYFEMQKHTSFYKTFSECYM